MQYPTVPGAHPDPQAVPGVHPDPPAVHVSGQDNSSTAAPVGGTNAELPSDMAREEAHPSKAESARNPSSAVADKPSLKRPKLSAAEEEGAEQAPASEGHSTAGEEEAKRQVAESGEEQGEEAVVGHSEEKEEGEAAPAAQAAPALPLGSMQPGTTPPHAVCTRCESRVT